MLDDDVQDDEDDQGARIAAEAELNARDGRQGGRMDHLMYDQDDDQVARRRLRDAEGAADDEGEKIENIEDTKGNMGFDALL